MNIDNRQQEYRVYGQQEYRAWKQEYRGWVTGIWSMKNRNIEHKDNRNMEYEHQECRVIKCSQHKYVRIGPMI